MERERNWMEKNALGEDNIFILCNNKLPDEIIEVILNTAGLCKKSQNFYINKYFLNISKKKINKCRKCIC
jgi:hypothetical protein